MKVVAKAIIDLMEEEEEEVVLGVFSQALLLIDVSMRNNNSYSYNRSQT